MHFGAFFLHLNFFSNRNVYYFILIPKDIYLLGLTLLSLSLYCKYFLQNVFAFYLPFYVLIHGFLPCFKSSKVFFTHLSTQISRQVEKYYNMFISILLT